MEHTPSNRLSDKTCCNMADCSQGNCETNDSLLKLKAVVLDRDSSNFLKDHWTKDIETWLQIRF